MKFWGKEAPDFIKGVAFGMELAQYNHWLVSCRVTSLDEKTYDKKYLDSFLSHRIKKYDLSNENINNLRLFIDTADMWDDYCGECFLEKECPRRTYNDCIRLVKQEQIDGLELQNLEITEKLGQELTQEQKLELQRLREKR